MSSGDATKLILTVVVYSVVSIRRRNPVPTVIIHKPSLSTRLRRRIVTGVAYCSLAHAVKYSPVTIVSHSAHSRHQLWSHTARGFFEQYAKR